MPLSIPLGTLLQNRYSLIDLLGQGGLGRTYLAKDQERSNELCIIQEMSVPVESWSSLTSEQFREQAFNLFRIRHPQVPQFRATFEQDDRLFVVRDYVSGVSYQALLNRRKAVGEVFRETEVIQFLLQVLPALEYLHDMGMSHGQLAPENIIWPTDSLSGAVEYATVGESTTPPLPVLINIGIVEEWVYRLSENPTSEPPAFETGPVSQDVARGDLYALAVTAIVLLTGKEPQHLLDPLTQQWNWEDDATISPALTQVLNRMLSENPKIRYQNSAEVAAALIFLEPISEVRPAERQPKLPETQKKRPKVAKRSWWSNPWLYIISLSLLLISGFLSWAIVKYLLLRSQPAPPVSSPTPTSPPPSILASTPPVPVSLPLNQPQPLEGTLLPGQTLVYQLSGQPWQQLNITLSNSSQVSMNLFNPAKQLIAGSTKPGTPLNGLFSSVGSYFLQLSAVGDSSPVPYQMQLRLTDYFPRKLCESPNLEKSSTWYPVLIRYNQPILKQVQQQYCRETFVTLSESGESPMIQVGAFENRQQAEAFATLMQRQAGGGEVGEAVTGVPSRSCGDADPSQRGYPVLMTYSKENYIQILSLCPGASVIKKQSQDYIEIATFAQESKAKQLATFIGQEVGQANVGDPKDPSKTEK